MICTHFVGVAPDQYYSALKIWGRPDFTHPRATWSCMGEIDGNDVVVLGRNAFPKLSKWRQGQIKAAHWDQHYSER